MAGQNPLQKLAGFGQSVWLDFLERGFVRRGELATLIREDAVSGLTSNPAIFQKAIAEHEIYLESIDAMARQGLAAHEIHEALVIEDIRAAADVLVDVFRRTNGHDGFVSLEVSPYFAHDAEGTYWEAKRLWALVDRNNLMIKVPGTVESVPVVRRLIADGVNVNVTLLFDVERYGAFADAYVAGLEDRAIRKVSPAHVASVASFFVSRIDALIDAKLDAVGSVESRSLRGECAVACARAAYRRYQSTVAAPRWRALETSGAQPQRLLWASTGTKDPTYSDVKYVEALVAPNTVTTLPPETLIAYRDHGWPEMRMTDRDADGESSIELTARRLADAGIDWQHVARQLEVEGIQKFIQSHEAILAGLRERIATVTG